ncbi:MAG TPA: hypothetical protein VNS58_25420 [Puia sp.]|nr:hypothetical protein [Puia sp.]
MKKLLFILLGGTLTSLGFAQTTPKKVEEKELRHDIREKREEKHEVGKDLAHLNIKKARADHKDVVTEKKAEHRHAAQLKRQGVKHPVSRAKHQIHAQDEAKKYQ